MVGITGAPETVTCNDVPVLDAKLGWDLWWSMIELV